MPAFVSRRIGIWKLTALTLVASTISAPTASAFRTQNDLIASSTTIPIRWSSNAIELHVSGAGNSEALQQTERAAAAWNEVSCSALMLTVGVADGAATHGDGRNTIEWVKGDWLALGQPAEAAAFTDVQLVESDGLWIIEEADIYLNAAVVGAEADPAFAHAVLTHELGHVLGLAHPCEVETATGVPACSSSAQFEAVLMHPVYSGARSALSADDVAGVCWLYPEPVSCEEDCPGTKGEGETCSGDQECTGTFSCRDGSCQLGDLVLGEPCKQSSECGSGACIGYCAPRCRSAADCTKSETCVHTSRFDGACVGSRAEFGASCSFGSDCLSGRCLAENDKTPICTSRCSSNSDCNDGWECKDVMFDESTMLDDPSDPVCIPPQDLQAGGGGGCAMNPESPSPGPYSIGAVIVGAAALSWRRRRQSAHVRPA